MLAAKTPYTSGLASDRCATPAWTPVTPRSHRSPVTTAGTVTTPKSAQPFTAHRNSMSENNVERSSEHRQSLRVSSAHAMTPLANDTGRLDATVVVNNGGSGLQVPGVETMPHGTENIDPATVTKDRPLVMTAVKDKPHVVRCMDFSAIDSPSLHGNILLISLLLGCFLLV